MVYLQYVGSKSRGAVGHRMIMLIEGNAKSLRLKSNLQKEFTAAVHLSEAPSSARFLY
jgi:hypothetical protein